MLAELSTLEKTCTWEIVDLPPNIKPMGCKWINKIKFYVDGSVKRFKAWLLSNGYNQIEGLYYFETYYPVAKMAIVWLVIALTITIIDLSINQI